MLFLMVFLFFLKLGEERLLNVLRVGLIEMLKRRWFWLVCSWFEFVLLLWKLYVVRCIRLDVIRCCVFVFLCWIGLYKLGILLLMDVFVWWNFGDVDWGFVWFWFCKVGNYEEEIWYVVKGFYNI